MIDRDLELSDDAPLRHRLWFRFWRGWRKVMLILMVPLCTAWATNPGFESHQAEFFPLRLPFSSAGLGVALSLTGDVSMTTSSRGWAYRNFVVFSAVSPEGGESWVTIGAFGYVWVLD